MRSSKALLALLFAALPVAADMRDSDPGVPELRAAQDDVLRRVDELEAMAQKLRALSNSYGTAGDPRILSAEREALRSEVEIRVDELRRRHSRFNSLVSDFQVRRAVVAVAAVVEKDGEGARKNIDAFWFYEEFPGQIRRSLSGFRAALDEDGAAYDAALKIRLESERKRRRRLGLAGGTAAAVLCLSAALIFRRRPAFLLKYDRRRDHPPGGE